MKYIVTFHYDDKPIASENTHTIEAPSTLDAVRKAKEAEGRNDYVRMTLRADTFKPKRICT